MLLAGWFRSSALELRLASRIDTLQDKENRAMDQQEHHQMLLETTHNSGAEEWYCPTCGRRFLLRWPPSYEKVVIEPGDEFATHSGSKGDMLRMHAADIVDPTEHLDD